MKTMALGAWLTRKKMTMTAFGRATGLDTGVVSRTVSGDAWPEFRAVAAIYRATKGAVTAHHIFLVCQRRRGGQ